MHAQMPGKHGQFKNSETSKVRGCNLWKVGEGIVRDGGKVSNEEQSEES